MHSKSAKYRKQVLSPLLFRMFMLKKLPSVVWWGIKIKALDESHCVVTIPYSWRTQNPFNSIYFAALSGAGELSTGALCQMYLADRGTHAMLAVDLRCEFIKKSESLITFTCTQGKELASALDTMVNIGDTTRITMESIGTNREGSIVAKIYITWSFKRKG